MLYFLRSRMCSQEKKYNSSASEYQLHFACPVKNSICSFQLDDLHSSSLSHGLLHLKLCRVNCILYFMSAYFPCRVSDLSQLFNICRFVFPVESKKVCRFMSTFPCLRAQPDPVASMLCNLILDPRECTTQILQHTVHSATRHAAEILQNMPAPLTAANPLSCRHKMNSSVQAPQCKLAFPSVTSSH